MTDQDAQTIVKDSLVLSQAIYGLIEGIDTKVYPIPGAVKSFLSWVLSLLSPYVWYGMEVAQGRQQFSFWVLLLIGTAVKAGAQLTHSAGDKGAPLVKEFIDRRRARRRAKRGARGQASVVSAVRVPAVGAGTEESPT
ncbi:MAG TPA: hypothetical protein VEX13_08720 [Chloroflexia bacterium]|nr:hypothetical protein [Chloroflexia bacterium]